MGTLVTALLGEHIRAYILDATDMVKKASELHQTSPVATAALGRTIAAASIMGKMLKGDKEKLTFQVKGKGEIKSILAVAWPNGHVKSYISPAQVSFQQKDNGKLDVGGLVGQGELVIIKDLGLKEPYVGTSSLITGEIAEDLAHYYMNSEQQPSLVALGVHVTDAFEVDVAGGLIVQPLPTISEEDLIRLEEDAGSIAAITKLLQESSSLEEALAKAFPSFSVNLTGEHTVELTCDCNRDRIERALISIGKEELTQIIEEDHEAELHCHFCNTKYHFTEEDLISLREDL